MSSNGNGAQRASTATLTRPDPPPRAVPLRIRRGRWGAGRLALLGLVAVLTVLALTLLVSRSSSRTPVLVMLADVPYGTTVTDADVGTAWVAVDPAVVTVPTDRRDTVIGQVATSALHRGQLLTPGSTGIGVAPAVGQVLVGLEVPAGRMPAAGLSGGDQVMVVPVPAAGPGNETPLGEPVTATVVRVGEPDLNGASVVDVTVPTGQGPGLARVAAAGEVSLVLLPAGG